MPGKLRTLAACRKLGMLYTFCNVRGGYYHIRNSRFERTPMNCLSSPYCRTNVRNFRGLFTAKVVKSHVKLRVKSDAQKVNWVHREPMLLKLT